MSNFYKIVGDLRCSFDQTVTIIEAIKYKFFNTKFCEKAMTRLACVAGGSGCARETFCGEAANFLAVEAREGIFASGEAGSEIPACLISYPF